MAKNNDSKRAQDAANQQAAEANAAMIAQQNANAMQGASGTDNVANVNTGGTASVVTGTDAARPRRRGTTNVVSLGV